MNEFRYVIQHLPGKENVWADMLTRWAVQAPQSVRTGALPQLKSMMVAPINPGVHSQFDWPSMTEIKLSQENSTATPSTRFSQKNGIFRDNKGVVWLPDDNNELKLRVIIAPHCGIGGHRASSPTQQTIASHFWWSKIETDVKSFVSSCLHCQVSAPGSDITRLLAHALHADAPNEIIHFDFCYMTPGENDFTYVLIIKDDLSGYVWLVPCEDADAISVAESLVQWFSTFGVAYKWV